MNYLKIENDGLIQTEDLTLIGSSTKRNQSGKIGMFGSGWKYALAYLFRNGLKPIIYSGKERFNLDTNIKLHRDNPVEIITVNGTETSLTTEMGLKWTGWMALREIISNAIDEGGFKIETVQCIDPNAINHVATHNKSIVLIPVNDEISQIMMQYERYFAFNRKPTYANEFGRIFIKGKNSSDKYVNAYRKGIRCYDDHVAGFFDFDCADVNINESRLASWSAVKMEIERFLADDNLPTDIMRRFLQPQYKGYLPLIEGDSSAWLHDDVGISKETIERHIGTLTDAGMKFLPFAMAKFAGDLARLEADMFIPMTWYRHCVRKGIISSDFTGNDQYQFMETGASFADEVAYHMSAFNVDIKVKYGACSVAMAYDEQSEKQPFVVVDLETYKDESPAIIAASIIAAVLPSTYFLTKMI